MKYLVITRSLQSDFQWEQDSINIASILLELLDIQFPKNYQKQYSEAFMSYFSRYISDSSIRQDDDPILIRDSLKYLLEQIEQTAQKSLDKSEFKFNYSDEDYDLLYKLLNTTIQQYYITNKPHLLEKVSFLKQDYGDDLVFINSARFYTNLTRRFYDHECDVFYSRYNDKEEMIAEYLARCASDENYELVLA